jgi:hypothetical protein
MVRIRHGRLVAVIGLALALVVACKKDDNTAGDKTGDKSGAGGAAADDLSLLPVDSNVVVGVNFAQVQQSPLWKQFVEPRMMTGEAGRKLAEFKDKCGFDAMAAIKTISAGVKTGGGKPEGTVVVHGLEKAKTWACLDKGKDDIAKEGGEYTRDGDVGMLKSKDGPPSAFTFVNDTTLVAVFGDNANAAGVKTAVAGNSALKSSPAFVDMYGKIKTSESLWMLVNGKALENMPMGVKASALYGSINVTDGLTMDMRMRVETPEAATQLANLGKTQAQQMAKMVDKADFTAEGNEVKVSVVLSSQKLQELIKMLGGLAGALGGMGGH